MKIIHEKVNDKNVSNLITILKEIYIKNGGQEKSSRTYFNPKFLNKYINKNADFIYMKDNEEIKSFCLYTPVDSEKVIVDFETEIEFYEEDEIEKIYDYISKINQNAIYLDYIESFEPN